MKDDIPVERPTGFNQSNTQAQAQVQAQVAPKYDTPQSLMGEFLGIYTTILTEQLLAF